MNHDRRGETMRLGAFFHPTGNHVAAWLHPEAQIDAGTNFQHYAQIAQTAERGKFDLMFVADAVAVRDGKLAALSRWPQYMVYFDPLTLLPAIAAVTKHIGVVATATTSYNEPYHIARKFASLDHINGGRAGWNVVTSSNLSEAYNFGREEHYEHSERYDRAVEFVDVVCGLWDSWDDDALIRDRASGRYFEPTKLHALNHKGKHFSVRGPLNVARSPQGYPVLFQAGSSEVGREMAARIAEGVFTPQHTLEGAQEFYRDLKGRMVRYGRPPEALKVMPGLNAIIGRTAKEADEQYRYLQSKIHPDVGLELLSNALGGFDLSEYDIDGPLPEIPDHHGVFGGQTSLRNVVRWAREERLTIRQLYERFAGARGQRTLKGSPVEIADGWRAGSAATASMGFWCTPPICRAGLTTLSIW
jgi:alkanesulfonate monooxygenase